MNEQIVDDSYILKNFFINGRLNGNHSTFEYMSEHNPKALEYLKHRFKDSESLRETFLRIYFGIEERPRCPFCGEPVSYRGKKDHIFNDTCGKGKCYCKKREITNLKKYGISNLGGTNPEKGKQTRLERYGDPNYNNREKSKITWAQKYGDFGDPRYQTIIEKRKQTSLKNYGFTNPNKSEKVKQKIKNTCLRKYGVDNYRKSEACKEKIIATRRVHGRITSSVLEKNCTQWVIEEFGKDNIISQYTDERYKNQENGHKYRCDLYIKPYDLFIEIQGYWAHGPHPFDPNNPEDLKLLEEWKQKSKIKETYNRGPESWTIIDPLKRKQASDNNLRYIEIFDRHITKETLIELIHNEIRKNNWNKCQDC